MFQSSLTAKPVQLLLARVVKLVGSEAKLGAACDVSQAAISKAKHLATAMNVEPLDLLARGAGEGRAPS